MFQTLKKQTNVFVESSREFDEFRGLSEDECRYVLTACDNSNFVIESVQCNTSKEEDYYQCHVWNLFCEDYLFHLEGWYWRAFEHHIRCYQKDILANDPEDAPLFEVSIAREFSNKDRSDSLNSLVDELKSDPNHIPKTFDEVKKVITFEVD